MPFFNSLGFKLPERKGVADFLQEVTSEKDQKVCLVQWNLSNESSGLQSYYSMRQKAYTALIYYKLRWIKFSNPWPVGHTDRRSWCSNTGRDPSPISSCLSKPLRQLSRGQNRAGGTSNYWMPPMSMWPRKANWTPCNETSRPPTHHSG